MTDELTFLTGIILEEETECNLADICRMCNISPDAVRDMIEEGVIRPRGTAPDQWRFTALEIRRIQVTQRLQRDLRINLPGCALVIELLDELEELRRLRRLL